MKLRHSQIFKIETKVILFLFILMVIDVNKAALLYAEGSQPRIAILDISELEISEANKTRIYNSVESSLSDLARFNIIPASAISSFKTADEKRDENVLSERVEKVKEAQLTLQKGKTYYDNAEFLLASTSLKSAIQTYEDNFDVITDSRPLLSAYLFLAMSYYALNQIVDGKLCFDRLLKLDPNVALDGAFVPPKITKAFEDYKRGIEDSATARIIITGDDKAKLYFNGKFIDDFLQDKPITLEKVYPGKHNILVTKKGYFNQSKSFVVTEGTITVSVKLKSLSAGRFSSEIKKSSRESAGKFLTNLGQDGKILADIILIFSISESLSEYFFEGQLFDVRGEIFSKLARISLGKDLKFPEDSAEKLIGELSNYLDENNMVLEKSLAEKKKDVKTIEVEEKPPVIQEYVPPKEDIVKKDTIRKEFEDENFETKKAMAWIIFGILILGGAAAGIAYYLSTEESGGAIEFYPP